MCYVGTVKSNGNETRGLCDTFYVTKSQECVISSHVTLMSLKVIQWQITSFDKSLRAI